MVAGTGLSLMEILGNVRLLSKQIKKEGDDESGKVDTREWLLLAALFLDEMAKDADGSTAEILDIASDVLKFGAQFVEGDDLEL